MEKKKIHVDPTKVDRSGSDLVVPAKTGTTKREEKVAAVCKQVCDILDSEKEEYVYTNTSGNHNYRLGDGLSVVVSFNGMGVFVTSPKHNNFLYSGSVRGLKEYLRSRG